jgi:hypothetical protein
MIDDSQFFIAQIDREEEKRETRHGFAGRIDVQTSLS